MIDEALIILLMTKLIMQKHNQSVRRFNKTFGWIYIM